MTLQEKIEQLKIISKDIYLVCMENILYLMAEEIDKLKEEIREIAKEASNE